VIPRWVRSNIAVQPTARDWSVNLANNRLDPAGEAPAGQPERWLGSDRLRIFTAAITLLIGTCAWADTFDEGLEVQCDQWQMRVRDFDFQNNGPTRQQNAGTTIYRDSKPHRLSCVVNKHKVEVDFKVLGGNKCGVGSLVTLKIDGQLIIKDAQIHGCPVGVTEIGVMPGLDQHGDYEFEICGYTRDDELPVFNGCVRIAATQLASMKKPLNPSFPIGELIRLVKFPS